jgi:hypothetical protein
VYKVAFERVDDSYHVRHAEILGDEEYVPGVFDVRVVDFLIRNLLLGESVPFPMPPDVKEKAPGDFQYAMTGTGYPEETLPKESPPRVESETRRLSRVARIRRWFARGK